MATETRRDRARSATITEIKDHARKQMQTSGAAMLSLRQIAEQMGLTPGALYRYYASRDALITDLIVDAFNSLADHLRQTDARFPRSDYRDRMHALLTEYRGWALQQPVDYQLIYGDPIPGYHAPGEITVPAAARVFVPIVKCLDEALRLGVIHPHNATIPDATLDQYLGQAATEYATLIGEQPVLSLAMYLGMDAWTRGHGLITLEMHGHTPPVVIDPDLFYRVQVDQIMLWLGFLP